MKIAPVASESGKPRPQPASRKNVALRVVLIVILGIMVLRVGIALARRLSSAEPTQMLANGLMANTPCGESLPNWGGGSLSFPARSAEEIVDSVRNAADENSLTTQTYAGQGVGIVLKQKSDSDYALTLALSQSGQAGPTALFELPSSDQFKRQLFPDSAEVQAPAADVPLYPGSQCQTQFGLGTACFIGFYLTPDSIEAVRSFYVRALSQLGWQRVRCDLQGPVETFAKSNGNRTVVVQLRTQDAITTRIGLIATTYGNPDRNERK